MFRPYTYCRLLEFINSLKPMNPDDTIFNKKMLCKSPGGLQVPLLTIEGKHTRKLKQRQNDYKHKIILIVARSIPADCFSSYMMERFIILLLSDDEIAIKLRKSFIFKVTRSSLICKLTISIDYTNGMY